jgi:glutathione S-transferase
VSICARVGEQLALVRERLRGGPYFGGERLSALDIYVATFLTPLSVIDEAACPQMSGTLRRAFASAREQFGPRARRTVDTSHDDVRTSPGMAYSLS